MLRPGNICVNSMVKLTFRWLLHLFPKKRLKQKNNIPKDTVRCFFMYLDILPVDLIFEKGHKFLRAAI